MKIDAGVPNSYIYMCKSSAREKFQLNVKVRENKVFLALIHSGKAEKTIIFQNSRAKSVADEACGRR